MDMYVSKYLDYLLYQKKYSSNTVLNYKKDILFFKDFLDTRDYCLFKVNYEIIREFYNYMDKRKYSKNTICRKISSLRSFYRYLVMNKYIKVNPFCLTKGPKKDKLLPKFLYYNELEELFNISNLKTLYGARDRLILEILYATGIRVGELENIKLSDINFDDNSIKVLGKGSKERIVYFGEYAREILDIYLDFRKDDCEYLFINKNKTRLTARGVRYILSSMIDKTSLNMKISPHMIRHSFATHMLNEGCDLLSVQELLGHESLRATQVYTHVTNDRLKDIYLKSHPRGKEIIGDKDGI